MNHLDDGVLSEPYGAALPKTARSTILTHLWPLTPIELGDGFVIGREKVLTKASGIFRNDAGANATVYVYEHCAEVAAVTAAGGAGQGAAGLQVSVVPGEVRVQLQPNQAAVVVWDV